MDGSQPLNVIPRSAMDYLQDLNDCRLCEHGCGVNRLTGEKGVCGVNLPVVASCMLHPAPPSSYTIFMAGCNFKCLNCQNWTISCYPEITRGLAGFVEPAVLAHESVLTLKSPGGQAIGADRLFFSGGAADIHLPYVEEVVRETRLLLADAKVNFDTNGYQTEEAFQRVLDFATSVTFDIKAFYDETHRALTGASVKPVLRNAEKIGADFPEKLWEYRILVVPGLNEDDVAPLCDFIASIDGNLPVCFLAFRPNFVLENHPGASRSLIRACLETARRSGLRNAHVSGVAGLPGRAAEADLALKDRYRSPSGLLAGTYARRAGCVTHPRNCKLCEADCRLRGYIPQRSL